jgi:hypothetical protein
MVNPHTFSFYTFAKHLHPLAELEANTPLTPALMRRMGDAGFVAEWFELSEFCSKYLPSSAKRLKSIQTLLKKQFLELDKVVAPHQAALGAAQLMVDEYWATRIREEIQEFETILQDEVAKLPIFCCDDDAIGNFSVAKLMKGASKGYPEKTRKRLLPECQREIDEAGRCLVYERSTAAGFHTLRSVELSIKQYLMAIPGFTMPSLNRQNWGEYLKLLKDNGAGWTCPQK